MATSASSLRSPAHPDPLPEGEGEIRRLSRRSLVLLISILLLAAALRIYNLDAKSFWFDEFATAELACGRGHAQFDLPDDVVIESPPNLFDLKTAAPIHKIWFADKIGHMPPLYIVITRLWGEIFGLGPMSLRGFATLASIAAIVALFFVMRDLSGIAPALWGALLMALAGPQIQFAQEARHYTLLLLEALTAAAALVRIEQRGPSTKRCMTLAIAVLAMTLTHYFSIGAIATLALYAVVRLRGRPLKLVMISFAAAAVAWLALGAPVALRQRHNLDNPFGTDFLNDASPGHAARTALRTALLPVRFFTEPMGNVTAPAAVGAIAFVLAVLLAWRRRDLLLWALWLWLAVLPIVLLDLLRKTQHLEFIRYTLLASPALYAIVAAVFANRPGRIKHLPPLLTALACALAIPAAYSTWWKADWRSLARQIDNVSRDGDVIIFWRGQGYEVYPNAAFLHTSYYRRGAYGPIVLMTKPPDEALRRRLREAPGMLLVTLSDDDVDRALPGTDLKRIAFEPAAGAVYRATWK